LLYNQRVAACDRETDRILSAPGASSFCLSKFTLKYSNFPHFSLSGDMASIVAPVKATAAADAAALAHETKTLFADVRSCRAAVSQLQVTAAFLLVTFNLVN
jgi:hypothetical protein